MAYGVANAVFQWEEGHHRLEAARDDRRRYAELVRVVAAVQDELRRRLGSTFTVAELSDLYAAGTDWCLEVAFVAAPRAGSAWDMQTVADAAFFLYMREAADYSRRPA